MTKRTWYEIEYSYDGKVWHEASYLWPCKTASEAAALYITEAQREEHGCEWRIVRRTEEVIDPDIAIAVLKEVGQTPV